jgi:hypothetical protein
MMDRSAANAVVRDRLRAEVSEAADVDAAYAIDEAAIAGLVALPALLVLIRYPDADEEVPGIATQNVDVEVTIGIVTQSSAETRAARAAEDDLLKQKATKAMHYWLPPAPWTKGRKFRFRGEEHPIVVASRQCSALKFVIKIQETYV